MQFFVFFSPNPSLESYKNIQLLNLNITITKQIKIQIYRKFDGQFLEHSSLLIKFYRKSNKEWTRKRLKVNSQINTIRKQTVHLTSLFNLICVTVQRLLFSVWRYGHLKYDGKRQPRDVERPYPRENPGCPQEPSPSNEGHDAQHGYVTTHSHNRFTTHPDY